MDDFGLLLEFVLALILVIGIGAAIGIGRFGGCLLHGTIRL